MAGQTPLQMPVQGVHQHSPAADSGSWAAQNPGYSLENGHSGLMGSGNPLNSGFLRRFPGMQKKTTRDGQVPKRRGPKPDSKPAQTRRQELNRQAQRTHRERRENYVKALEFEVIRQKEDFVVEMNNASQQLENQRLLLRDQQSENAILRDMLLARGIPFEHELEGRKMNMSIPIKRDPSSVSPAHIPTHPSTSTGPASAAGFSPLSESGYSNETPMSMAGHSPTTTFQGHSPAGPEIQEFAIKQERDGTPDMPGIFEREPQLGIDFILQLEHTCRDHDEYLVRRSVNSGDTEEDAKISGHALMASCPPISHVKNVPAQQGGLIPTYEHKVPDAEIKTLQTLLNLSTAIRAEIPGGQVTPVMALQCLRGHRNYQSLTREDVLLMIESIRGNVRCYGFGAVMEDFELRDALSSIFAAKPETYETMGNEYNAEIEDMYS